MFPIVLAVGLTSKSWFVEFETVIPYAQWNYSFVRLFDSFSHRCSATIVTFILRSHSSVCVCVLFALTRNDRTNEQKKNKF